MVRYFEYCFKHSCCVAIGILVGRIWVILLGCMLYPLPVVFEYPYLHENCLLITPSFGSVMINLIPVTKRHVDCVRDPSELLPLLSVSLTISRDVSELQLILKVFHCSRTGLVGAT